MMVEVAEAQVRLEELFDALEAGMPEITLTRDGQPLARLELIPTENEPR